MKQYRCLLPKMLRKESHITRIRQTVFGGLSSLPDAKSHEISDMMGLSPTAYPAMGTAERQVRYETDTWGTPHGIFHHRDMVMARGERLYTILRDGETEEIAALGDTDKRFAAFGPYLFIMPDGICYDADTGEIRSLSLSVEGLSQAILGERYLTVGTLDWKAIGFCTGDGIAVTVRNYYLGSNAVFYRKITGMTAGTLFLDEGFDLQGEYDISVSLAFPKLNRMLSCGDRLMGCIGNTVYISEAGNPFNWYKSQNADGDPVELRIGGAGDVTACASLDGYAVFFKSDRIYRLMGRSAHDYIITELSAPGLTEVNADSLCELGGKLYYLASGGVYAYDGETTAFVGAALPQGLTRGIGGSDGVCYHLSAYTPDGRALRCVYHPERCAWYVTGQTRVVSMASWEDLLFCQTADGELLRNARVGEVLGTDAGRVKEYGSESPSFAIFGEAFGDSPDGLRLHAIHLRAEGNEDAVLTVRVAYDGQTAWETVGTIRGGVGGFYHMAVYPRRAQSYRIRMDMTGTWRVSEMVCDYEKGKQ
ncbi:MAG: hypothetical protein J6D87_00545 [Clostridia bacterium]|nr:hypothetical protein [Clostridia bacterium]